MNFGRYYVGQDFSEIAENAKEVSNAHRAVHIKEFEDEIEYQVDNDLFFNTPWATAVTVSAGKVCQIFMQTLENYLDHSLNSEIFYDNLYKHLNDKFPEILTQRQERAFRMTAWGAPWGNVILIKAIVKINNVPLDEYTLVVTGGYSIEEGRKNKMEPFMEMLISSNEFSAN